MLSPLSDRGSWYMLVVQKGATTLLGERRVIGYGGIRKAKGP